MLNAAHYVGCMPRTNVATEMDDNMSATATSLDLLTAAAEGAASGLVVADARAPDHPIVFVNSAFSALTGYSAGEIIGQNCRVLQGSDTDRNTVATLRTSLANGRTFIGDLLNYRKDGSTFWNRLQLRTVAGADGKPRHFVATLQDVTDEYRIRERARASEARLELAMAASGLAMWDWNVVTGEIFYNDQWQTLLEAPAEELLLRESLPARLVLPDTDPVAFAELERHLAGDTPRFEREFDLETVGGKTKSIAARANVVRRAPDGQPLRVIGVWRDVTARKSHVRSIEEAHRRWERAVAGTSDGLFDWDLATGHVWYAPRFREQLGYDETEFEETFSAFQNSLHDEDRVTVLAKIRNHLEQRAPLDVRCRVRGKSGEHRWFRLRGSAERDAAGRPRRLSGSLRDISGQIDAEQALHRSEDFYRTVLDALPLTVAYIDRNEIIVYANQGSGELVGKEADLLRGKPMREVLNPDLYTQLSNALAAASRNESRECQVHTQDAAGRELEIEVAFVPHRGNGEVQGCFLMARNVTARARLEAELRQSQKMEAIGRLTGGVAHDFNNLLSVTIGNAQLLSRTLKDSPRLHRQAETIMRAAMRGAELTRRLLTFARQQQPMTQAVKVNDLIDGMQELLRRTLPTDIDLRVQLDASVQACKLDPGQFENALLNLVINARDAMPQGGSIVLRSQRVVLDGNALQADSLKSAGAHALVSVSDTGTGMTPEVVQQVFEPFFTTKDSSKGSGLGLPMVQTFVKSCSGYIHIDSSPGRGTTVSLYFPLSEEAGVDASGVTVDASELPRGVESILVVDDNPDVRATAVEMLLSLGYEVFSATAGRDALEIAKHEANIDVVFSDAMLPGGLSSMALIRKLRDLHPNIKPLLTSGFSESVVAHRSLLDGSIDVLPKPYAMNELARRVRAVLDSSEENTRVQARK